MTQIELIKSKKSYWEFTEGDRVSHSGEILTFRKMDGAYAQFIDKNGDIRIGSYHEYEIRKDGIYYPLNIGHS